MLCAGLGCDEGGGCNEVVMEVAMDVVMIKGDKDKTLFIMYILHTITYIIYFICTADGCIGTVAKSQSFCKQKYIKMTML